MPQYWVVGAMWRGRDDQFVSFIREGYWRLGWGPEEQPVQARRRDQIRLGDGIAIKKRSASNPKKIQIRAVGFVTGIDQEDQRIYVSWVASDLHHEVDGHGCFASIHGPFHDDDDWTRRAFLLENLEHRQASGDLPDLDDDLLSGQEGSKCWRLHLAIERNRKLVESKKAQARKECGSLKCEVCAFNFANFYGELGADFCEVHHRLPLSDLEAPVTTKLDDLAIVCSNCHRMIHRTDPLLTVEDFRDQLRAQPRPLLFRETVDRPNDQLQCRSPRVLHEEF